ncbi:MAG: PmoA family protein [Bryobacterales bacterium]|nr:PmoA family protein [Bryobacterales bacterium]
MNSRLLVVLLAVFPLWAQVRFTQGAEKISVEIDGKPFTEFFYGPAAPKPYLHPLRAASGVIVSRHFPMAKVEGETTDHPHHRGLWFTHGDVNGVDFWANEPPGKRTNLGRVVINKIVSAQDGKIAALFDWVGPSGNKLVAESRTMTFYSDPRLRTIDLDITLTPVGTVKFGDTKEGTFAVRVASGLEAPGKNIPADPPRTGKMIDAEGRESEAGVWGKRAPWVDVYGEVEGQRIGIAIMDHPANPHYPTFWHCRAYGLCAANPFGAREFMNDQTQDGSITLRPGQTLRFRYRVVIHPGDPQTAGIAAQYKQFSAMR